MISFTSRSEVLMGMLPTIPPKLLSAARILLTFVIAGPVVGLVTFAIGFAIATGSPNVLGFVLIYGSLFAHLMGVLPAAISGAAVAAYAAWRGQVPLWIGAMSGAAGLFAIPGLRSLVTSDTADAGMVMRVLLPVTCVVSGIACTRLTRRWQRVGP